MRSLWTLGWLVAFSIYYSACGKRDGVVNFPEDYWNQNNSQLATELESYYRSRDFSHIIHIHFGGNDFGVYKSLETQIKLSDSDSDRQNSFFSKSALPLEDAALGIETHYEDTSILASLIYRHRSAKKANAAFRELFACEDGRSEKIKKTMVVGTGGSHGAYELQVFAKQLQKDCGKKLDFVILGDAIAQPGPFPMHSFTGQEPDALCIHFFQGANNLVLHGAPMKNCTNIRVRKMGHFGQDGLTQFPARFVQAVLRDLKTSETGLGLVSKKYLVGEW